MSDAMKQSGKFKTTKKKATSTEYQRTPNGGYEVQVGKEKYYYNTLEELKEDWGTAEEVEQVKSQREKALKNNREFSDYPDTKEDLKGANREEQKKINEDYIKEQSKLANEKESRQELTKEYKKYSDSTGSMSDDAFTEKARALGMSDEEIAKEIYAKHDGPESNTSSDNNIKRLLAKQKKEESLAKGDKETADRFERYEKEFESRTKESSKNIVDEVNESNREYAKKKAEEYRNTKDPMFQDIKDERAKEYEKQASSQAVDSNNYHTDPELRKKDYENDMRFYEEMEKKYPTKGGLEANKDYQELKKAYESEFGKGKSMSPDFARELHEGAKKSLAMEKDNLERAKRNGSSVEDLSNRTKRVHELELEEQKAEADYNKAKGTNENEQKRYNELRKMLNEGKIEPWSKEEKEYAKLRDKFGPKIERLKSDNETKNFERQTLTLSNQHGIPIGISGLASNESGGYSEAEEYVKKLVKANNSSPESIAKALNDDKRVFNSNWKVEKTEDNVVKETYNPFTNKTAKENYDKRYTLTSTDRLGNKSILKVYAGSNESKAGNNDWVRDAFNEYKKQHPGTKMTIADFKKNNKK